MLINTELFQPGSAPSPLLDITSGGPRRLDPHCEAITSTQRPPSLVDPLSSDVLGGDTPLFERV